MSSELWRIVANDVYSVFVDTQKTFLVSWLFKRLFFAIFILVEVIDFEAFIVSLSCFAIDAAFF